VVSFGLRTRFIVTEKRPPTPIHGTLFARIIRTTVAEGRISAISLPKLDNRFIVVGTRDIGGTNRIKAIVNAMPLFTSSTVAYKGQPILAIFGPDSESVELAAREVVIEYEQEEEQQTSAYSATPYTYSFGSLSDAIVGDEMATIERTYQYGALESASNTLSVVSAELDGDDLHIRVPTQWPNHVRDTVADVTGHPKKRIFVHSTSFHAPHDEMLLTPSAHAAIAALGALKSGTNVRLFSSFTSRHPRLKVTRTSWYTPDGQVHAEKVDAQVDQGAFLFFSDEMANHLIAGLTPIYHLDALSISITFASSAKSPAHFYGDLGYSDALSSTEAHYNSLSRLVGFNPLTWRLKYIDDGAAHAIKTEKRAKLKEVLEEVSQRSGFLRKHAAYQMQAQMKVKLSTFINYSRGIALSCAAGISGFSSECRHIPQQPVQVTLNPNNKVEINTSLPSSGTSADVWKQIISDELSIEKGDISFTEEGSRIIDSGPTVLSVPIGRMPQQIKRACALIKEKRFVQPLPICESVLSPRQGGANTTLFTSNTWVAVVLELEIDAIMLQPVIRSVWTTISMPKAPNEKTVKAKARQLIVRTLKEAGGVLSNDASFDVDINIISEGDQLPSSISSAVRAAVDSAFISAVEQALGTPVTTFPVDGNVLLAAIKGKS